MTQHGRSRFDQSAEPGVHQPPRRRLLLVLHRRQQPEPGPDHRSLWLRRPAVRCPLARPCPTPSSSPTRPAAPSAVNQVRIVEQLDPNLDPRSFRLGDLQLGNLQVQIPSNVGSFQGDFDFTQSEGFILRVSAGIDVNSGTITWLLQAIDPNTGELITNPTVGLLQPNNSSGVGQGWVTYTAEPKQGLTTGTLDQRPGDRTVQQCPAAGHPNGHGHPRRPWRRPQP